MVTKRITPRRMTKRIAPRMVTRSWEIRYKPYPIRHAALYVIHSQYLGNNFIYMMIITFHVFNKTSSKLKKLNILKQGENKS